MNRGRRAGLASATGLVNECRFWGLSAATAISALLARYDQALVARNIFGGFWLLYLAVRVVRTALITDLAIAPGDDIVPSWRSTGAG